MIIHKLMIKKKHQAQWTYMPHKYTNIV